MKHPFPQGSRFNNSLPQLGATLISFCKALVTIAHSFFIVKASSHFSSPYNTSYSSCLKTTPMSEDHANFFTSAVPGNELSITTGSNGDWRGGGQHSEEPLKTKFTHEA